MVVAFRVLEGRGAAVDLHPPPHACVPDVRIQTAAFSHHVHARAGRIVAYLQDRSLANTCAHWERIRSTVFILSERVMHSSGIGPLSPVERSERALLLVSIHL